MEPRQDLRFDPVPIASSSSYALPWRRRITRNSFAREWNASEFTARFNSPTEPTRVYSSTFSRVACRQVREGDVNTERTGIPRNSRLTEFVVRVSAVCMQQPAIQSDSSRFRCTCCPRRTACASGIVSDFSRVFQFSARPRSRSGGGHRAEHIVENPFAYARATRVLESDIMVSSHAWVYWIVD